jgi:hypothetical protein
MEIAAIEDLYIYLGNFMGLPYQETHPKIKKDYINQSILISLESTLFMMYVLILSQI